jgi:hypothetical protein
MVRENAPRQRNAPSSRSQGDPASAASSRNDNASTIYARRALPAHRDPVCRTDCHQLDNGGGACKQDGVCLALIRDEEAAPAAPSSRPRMIRDVVLDYYQEGTR